MASCNDTSSTYSSLSLWGIIKLFMDITQMLQNKGSLRNGVVGNALYSDEVMVMIHTSNYN